MTSAKANLIEAHARPDQNGKGAGANFRIERTAVAFDNTVKLFAVIGDGSC